jgi:hypothetical protein
LPGLQKLGPPGEFIPEVQSKGALPHFNRVKGEVMAFIEALIFAGAAGFGLIVVITAIVIFGIRKEERYLTLANRDAPSVMAQLARLILGRYVRRENGRERRERHDDEALTPSRTNWPWD